MTHPNPVVIPGSGVPEVEQEFEAEVRRHAARLATEPRQDWYFTFGCGNTHPVTGEDLMGSYVVINGTYMQAREAMLAAFGSAWCDQYVDAERAGVQEYSLRRIELPVSSDLAPPVTPAEERTGVSDVQHAVVEEVAALRVLARHYMPNPDGRNDALARLDRIEQWTRGEQR